MSKNLLENYAQIKISDIDFLMNGDVTNYIDQYWIVKDDAIFVEKRMMSLLTNKDKRIVEMLAKNADFKDTEIKQISIICLNDRKLKRLIDECSK